MAIKRVLKELGLVEIGRLAKYFNPQNINKNKVHNTYIYTVTITWTHSMAWIQDYTVGVLGETIHSN